MQTTLAAVEDAPAIAAVHVRSWQAAYEPILKPEYLASLSIDARAGRWREILLAQESTTLVVRDSGLVLGFVSHGKCRDKDAPQDQGEIWALYAEPSAWRRGIGRELLGQALEHLRAGGFKAISLWVLSGNTRGRAFYEACGFKPVPESEQIFELAGRQVEEVKYVRLHDA
jgi:ribosomal protein S18 acetylase RimI-like enzyme